MKGLIIGNEGSIGRRHWNNIECLNEDIMLIGADKKNGDDIEDILGSNLDLDFGIVCSTTNYHIEHCEMLAERGIPFLCEKPLFGYGMPNCDKLFELVKKNCVPNMVACNCRFYEKLQAIRGCKFVNSRFGFSLEKWNANNHLLSYSANRNQGGGILYDSIHEFDYLKWIFGEIDSVDLNAVKLNSGTQTIDTEDLLYGFLKFKNGTVAKIHLDYLCETYTRYCEYFDGKELKRINLYPNESNYIDEICLFLDDVVAKKKSYNSVFEAAELIWKIEDGTKWNL